MSKKNKRQKKYYYVVECADCGFRKTKKTASEAADEAEKHAVKKAHSVSFYREEE